MCSCRLGAWQFLADMPYVSVSLSAIWKIFYTLYCTQSRAKSGSQGCDDDGSLTNLEGQRLSTAEEIIAAVQSMGLLEGICCCDNQHVCVCVFYAI